MYHTQGLGQSFMEKTVVEVFIFIMYYIQCWGTDSKHHYQGSHILVFWGLSLTHIKIKFKAKSFQPCGDRTKGKLQLFLHS